ncbi:hypothetical protein NP233_g3529 [Leucocoprinus birnbaumii]|uniref:G domain-containing protein n=1 Tax=Leucocoprinus birnbaumii TaxID=56174 RepID=A0AAD5YY97_9AGAR|nr:hypothetical protein NP233_g3529 [Leucocoprinus birnbaumii]
MTNAIDEFDYTDLLQDPEILEVVESPDSEPLRERDDIVIAVMGATGSGKSSFVKLLTGDDSVAVGNSLDSETSDIQVIHYADRLVGRNITIVDTPGFDDSRDSITDTEILKRITKFLLDMYDEDRKLNGLIYVQRISDPRFSGQSGRNLRMFRNLCGEGGYKNVVVLTTFWDKVTDIEEGKTREEQLKSKFFDELVQGGACFMQHDRSLKGAQDVLEHILTLDPTNIRIQEEIRVEGKSLEDTSAGSVHRKEVEEIIAKHKKEVAALKSEMDEVGKNNAVLTQELKEERDRLQHKLKEWETERDELKKGLEEEKDAIAKLRADAENEKKNHEQWREDREREWTDRLNSQTEAHGEELEKMKAELEREREDSRKREQRVEELMKRLEEKAENDRKALEERRQEEERQWSNRIQAQADAHAKALQMMQDQLKEAQEGRSGSIEQVEERMKRLEIKAKEDKMALENEQRKTGLAWDERMEAQAGAREKAKQILRAQTEPLKKSSEYEKLQEALKRARTAEVDVIKLQRELERERNKTWKTKGKEVADAIPVVGVFAKPSLVIGGAVLDALSKTKKRR